MPARLNSVAIACGKQWPADLIASIIGANARARSSAITVALLRLLQAITRTPPAVERGSLGHGESGRQDSLAINKARMWKLNHRLSLLLGLEYAVDGWPIRAKMLKFWCCSHGAIGVYDDSHIALAYLYMVCVSGHVVKPLS